MSGDNIRDRTVPRREEEGRKQVIIVEAIETLCAESSRLFPFPKIKRLLSSDVYATEYSSIQLLPPLHS